MKYNYSHSQTGIFLLSVLIIPAIITVIVELTKGSGLSSFFWIVPVVLLIAALIFARMGVTVDNKEVRLALCFGLFVKHIDLQRIVSCRIVQPKWYHGIGIHFVGNNAILYNVSFGKAVEITLISGSKIQIGSNDCEALAEAITKELRR